MMSRSRPNDSSELPAWISAAAVLGTLVTLAWLERRRPLRIGNHEAKGRRAARNIAVAGLAAAALQMTERPLTSRLTRLVERRRLGLVQRLPLPAWLQTLLACVLLDYTLYVWHVLAHKVPMLWRFHRVHHCDLDLDASTGIRFHFGEMILSVAWRAVQILTIGVSRRALSIWNSLLLMEVMFHHSNVALPARAERWLSRLLVTPRLHGIHHSIKPEEMNSNWSSGLTVWDALHRTLRDDVPQDQITIGIEDLREPDEVILPKLVAMPFTREAATRSQITHG
jgi:sterol desaturase/sphingolipid hydroxylase (fatty acid hydroxylase superfamily)